MKKKLTKKWIKGTILLAAFSTVISLTKGMTAYAESMEETWIEEFPGMSYEEYDEQYSGNEEELIDLEWETEFEIFYPDDLRPWESFEETEDLEISESLEDLWSFDESELDGADPKRADLLEENEGKEVTLEKNWSDEIWIGVYPLAQYPEFPTGCEVTSLTMVLNYEGFDVTIGELADWYLEKGEPASKSYREIFWGDPRSPEAFGCFAPVIADTANRYLEKQGTDKRAIDLSGTPLENLYEELRYGYPVLVWGSMYIDRDIVPVGSWEIDGETVIWYGNEHCMVLTGFDLKEDTVTVCDPLRGIMVYDRERFEEHYIQMECQAIVIREEEKTPVISDKE